MDSPITPNFALLRLIRDAGSTRNAQRQLLDALALRCNVKERYVCWPTYATLSRDTGLGLNTLKVAARALEQQQLIRRRSRRDSANRWWINVPLLLEQLEERLAQKKAIDEAAAGDCPFGDSVAIFHEENDASVSSWDHSGGGR